MTGEAGADGLENSFFGTPRAKKRGVAQFLGQGFDGLHFVGREESLGNPFALGIGVDALHVNAQSMIQGDGADHPIVGMGEIEINAVDCVWAL